MLTDTKIRSLKPTRKLYKVANRDGLYVAVITGGAISFRYNYRINGRQETLTIGAYGIGGITLAQAREKQLAAKKLVQAGISPAREKIRTKARDEAGGTFGAWAHKWLKGHKMADSTRDVQGRFSKLKLREISGEDVRAMANAIVKRGAPATAIHAREIILLVFRYAIERGQKVPNPGEEVAPSTIATFEPRERSRNRTLLPLPRKDRHYSQHSRSLQAAPADTATQGRTHQCQVGRRKLHRRHAHHSCSQNEGAPPTRCVSLPTSH